MGALVGALAVAAAGAWYSGLIVFPGTSQTHSAPRVFISDTGLYVDPDSDAAHQVDKWEAEGRAEDALRMSKVANQPMPVWESLPTGQVGAEVSAYVGRATAAGARPFLVAYNIPQRGCTDRAKGGAKDAHDYRAWIRELNAGLGGHEATIVLEPDAVAQQVSGCSQSSEEERYGLLADAVKVLKSSRSVKVYIDAGNPGFGSDTDALADALKRSGIASADGFSLNVASFYPTDNVVEFGKELSEKVGNAHFIVDTGRNGNGEVDGDQIDGADASCNPPGRALGQEPTTNTGDPVIDGFLWIKRVGESDGPCRPGEPPAGQWWPEYALSLVPETDDGPATGDDEGVATGDSDAGG
jgi:endoglucanase